MPKGIQPALQILKALHVLLQLLFLTNCNFMTERCDWFAYRIACGSSVKKYFIQFWMVSALLRA